MKRKYVAMILLFLLSMITAVYTEDTPGVEMFSPQGVVKNVRQATARFSEQMVPFGDPRGSVEPFEIDCPEKGTGRWADGRNWVYDFERDLPAGVVCTFRIKSGLKTLSGKKIKDSREFSFSTGGPSVRNSVPYQGARNIEEEQIFILTLDAEPDTKSVLKNVFFSVEGIQDFTGVKIIEGSEREELLKSQHRFRHDSKSPLILLQCRQQFPSDTNISLIWGKKVSSVSGVTNDKDQILRFKTRRTFSANFHCSRENAEADCIPMLPVSLNFSAPVAREYAGKITLKGKDGKTWKPQLEEEEDNKDFVYNVSFRGPFPESSSFKLELPSGIRDDAGRKLANANNFPMEVKTGKYPPLAKFAARFGILELKADPVLPVTLRNIEQDVNARMIQAAGDNLLGRMIGKVLSLGSGQSRSIQGIMQMVANAERETSILNSERGAAELKIPKPSKSGAMEVVGIPLKKPGLYVVEIESNILGASLLGKEAPMYVATAVLVTDLSVHFKWGRESSLVWVTALSTGKPAGGAEVTIKDCTEKVIWQGKTDANGIAHINLSLPSSDELPGCKYNSLGSGLFVTAKSGDDMSFVYSSWDEGIEAWRFQLPQEYSGDPSIAATVFDRTLLRAGETVHMKHVIRNHTMKGFTMLQKDSLPGKLVIEHYGSNDKFEFPLAWDAKGVAVTDFSIPKDAKLGTYGVTLQKKSSGSSRWRRYSGKAGGEFRVEEFRVPLLKGSIKPPAEPLINADKVSLDLSVQYLAGGGAGLIPVKLRSGVRPKYSVAFKGFEDFVFAGGPVKEGIIRGGQYMEDYEEPGSQGEEKDKSKMPPIDTTLDKFGGARVTIQDLPGSDSPQELLTEIEFRDPNGELQTISSKIPLWSSAYLVGIKPDSWAVSKENFRFHTAVLDLEGRPVAGAPVKVSLFTKKSYTHRKRLVGGFYAYEYITEIKKAGILFEGKTDAKGRLISDVISPASGNVILVAESLDKKGNRTFTSHEVWVAGKGEWWFEVSDNDRIDLIPEKKSYEPGETAVFQLRMPFRSATALVTVEREGVMESWVKHISAKQPVIEVPLKDRYAPNCFVSALVVRGRVSGVKPTAMADMGRPAYKLGIAGIRVGWKAHELKVSVKPDRRVYRIREKSRVRIKVTAPGGGSPPAGSEAAIAAVDEGLLELMPNKSWDLLHAMMGERGYEVRTATAQMQVIGKRHFGLKALPHGGGGGRQTTRELFDTLLLWKARVLLDNRGEALVDIPLNDSITGFRIVAIAQAGAGLFGTGSASIQSTQDLMILPGLPPLVREGDEFRGEFTLRNTTKARKELNASLKIEGIPGGIKPLDISLLPGEAKEIGWDIKVPFGVTKLTWLAEAAEKGTDRKDSVRITQKVVPAVPVSTFQATITQVDKDYRISVDRPKDAIPGRGGVAVILKPRLAEGQGGITDYMKAYPYSCMEQKISIAVSLRDKSLWDKNMSELGSYLDGDGLARYFPSCYYGSPSLTSYIISIGDEAGWEIPANLKEKMAGGLKRFVEGSISRYSPIATADTAIKKLSAIEALSRSGNAGANLLGSISIDPNLWPTSAVIDWFNILHNMKDIPKRGDRIREAEQILRSRLNFQGTRMGFSTEGTDYLWWLMVSNDVNSVRLILSLINAGKWKEDMPRIVLGALSRQWKGRWDLTLANAWGMLALERFSQEFESVPVSGETAAGLSGKSLVNNWKSLPDGGRLLFAWPEKKDELSLSHRGKGKPWATVQSLAAIPLKESLSSGYKIKKTVTPVEQKLSGKWSRGDIFRVRLDMEAQADQTWVVVSDPVPAGAAILGKGLSRDSEMLTTGEERKGFVWPAFEERSFEAFRAYYEYVPKGKWTVEYTVRLNQSGIFQLPATRAEALYFPEMFGEIPNKAMEVIK